MNVGGFSKHRNKTSGTDRHKRFHFIAGVSQVNGNIMKRTSHQWFELQVAKCLVVHVLSSSYEVSGFEL